MRAMILRGPGQGLELVERPVPAPGPGELLIRVAVCGVCRTDLHVADGELPETRYPIVPGHQVVGRVADLGQGVQGWRPGQRVGLTWLGGHCGACAYCQSGRENLCPQAEFTGCHRDGGFAEFCVGRASHCLALPEGDADLQVAPRLCAGAIGYRALRLAGEGKRVGLFGFGSAAHLLAQVLAAQGREAYAFVRSGDLEGVRFAAGLGAVWAGASDERPPVGLDCAIIFASDGALVPAALAALLPGGTVVCAGIHMSPIPAFDYRLLWGERCLRSVANLTLADARDLLALAARIPLRLAVRAYPLEQAQAALDDLRRGRVHGSLALQVARGPALGSAGAPTP